MELFITGTGQHIGVHDRCTCIKDHCCIHNPSNHHMASWPLHWRSDRGVMERICPHGVGHPDPDDLAFHSGDEYYGVHGCDGCCSVNNLGEV